MNIPLLYGKTFLYFTNSHNLHNFKRLIKKGINDNDTNQIKIKESRQVKVFSSGGVSNGSLGNAGNAD